MREEYSISKQSEQADIPEIEATRMLRHLQAQEAAKARGVADRVVWVHGRIKAILATLTHDFGRQCHTDDGEVFVDLLLPYYVELAHLTSAMAYPEAVARIRGWLPYTFATRGLEWFEREWGRLCELRSVAVAARDANPEHRDKPYVFWLPDADTVSRKLQLTRTRRESINKPYADHADRLPIRGLPAIDPLCPDEAREADRMRKEKERRAKGVKSQACRTRTADEAAFRESLGITYGTWNRAVKKGPDAVLALVSKFESAVLMVDKMCPADIDEYGADSFYPLLSEVGDVPKIEAIAGVEIQDLTERFKLVAADYVKGPALQPTIPTSVRAQIRAMPLPQAA